MAKIIRAIIWDVGGVLLRTEDMGPRQLLAQQFKMTAQELESLVYHNEVAQRVEIGKAVEEDNWRYVFERLNLNFDELDTFRHAFWGGDQLDVCLVEFIRTLRSTYKLGILSNAWPGFSDMLTKHYDLLKNFDVCVFSAQSGVKKPNSKIYEIVLDRLGVQAHEAIFIDDMEKNIEGAQKVGLHGVHFKTPDQVRMDLQNILLDSL